VTVAAVNPALTFAALLGTCVWIGGLVVIAVVVDVARRQLDPPAQVVFFRSLGRRYLPIGCAALTLALGAGAGLLSTRRWDGAALAAVLVAAALVVTLTAGVAQARGMTRLRVRLLGAPTDLALAGRVRRGAVRAAALRTAIGLLSLALLAWAAVLACR
jgi:uncharacterized membrane protein